MLSKGTAALEDYDGDSVVDSTEMEDDKKKFRGMLTMKLEEAGISEEDITSNEYYQSMSDSKLIETSILDFYTKLKSSSPMARNNTDIITMMRAVFKNYDKECEVDLDTACESLSNDPEAVKSCMVIKAIINGD